VTIDEGSGIEAPLDVRARRRAEPPALVRRRAELRERLAQRDGVADRHEHSGLTGDDDVRHSTRRARYDGHTGGGGFEQRKT
jgi:hypothetical protein